MPPPPEIDQVLTVPAFFRLLPRVSFLPVVNLQQSAYLPVVFTRVWFSQTSDDLCHGVRRMAKLYTQFGQDFVQLSLINAQVGVEFAHAQFLPSVAQLLILADQGCNFLSLFR